MNRQEDWILMMENCLINYERRLFNISDVRVQKLTL